MAACRKGKYRLMKLVLLILILMLGFASTIISRGNLVLLMLLPASQFLGFVDPMQIAVKGVFDVHALIVIIIMIAILISIREFKLLFNSELKLPILVFFLLWCYGVIYPWLMGNSSLFYSLKSSKEFLNIFSYVAILLFIKKEREIDLAWKYLIGLGIYYSVVELVGQFTGPALHAIMAYDMRRDAWIFTKIYVPFWPVILIALFLNYYSISRKISKPYLRTFISFLGLMLTFFRSYLVASFVVVPIVLIIVGQGILKTMQRITGLVVILLVSLVLFSFVVGNGLDSLDKFSDKFFVSAITEVATHSGGHLLGREHVTEDRRKFLMKNPLLGYGFVDKDSTLGKKLVWIINGDNLGFIDRGVLDVPIKFGYIGYAVLLISVQYMIISLLRMAKKYNKEIFKVRCMTMATILIISIIVLPIHAPFTYSFSLLPLGIALGLIEKQRSILDMEQMRYADPATYN